VISAQLTRDFSSIPIVTPSPEWDNEFADSTVGEG
jgi:hypothetical protein